MFTRPIRRILLLLAIVILGWLSVTVARPWLVILWFHGKVPLPAPVFLRGVYPAAGTNQLRYRLLSPYQPAPDRRYPLVVALHGGGSEGADNAAQLNCIVPAFTADDARVAFPCYVLAPQCPPNTAWVPEEAARDDHYRFQRVPSTPLRQTLELIDQLRKDYPIDPARIYLVGYSRGATGGWDALIRRPQLFAAATLICGRGNPAHAAKIIHIPLWVAHGARDEAIATVNSRAMVIALRRAGGNPVYHEYAGGTHDIGWEALNEPTLLPWLFSQHR